MNNQKPHSLLTLADLGPGDIRAMLERAEYHASASGGETPLAGRTLANLFYETSTRTRVSFELAARRLGATVVNLDIAASSTAKGESPADTVRTLHAMGIGLFVVRHGNFDALQELERELQDAPLGIACAGAGTVSHPTQGLIDALTLKQHFGDCSGIKVAIIGDIMHSRVAHSAVEAFAALDIGDIRIAGPEALLPGELPGARKCASFDEAIDGVDAVMMLRVQRERIEETVPDPAAYHAEWGLTAARLQRAGHGAIVLHPGPFNRGVEIDGDVADGERSKILQQVRNGIPVRMAVLEWMCGE